ncbi:MAG: acyl-CoA synthetase FdrA [Thermogemmatispora sp.]|uniref:acyl-CoA synthetase FdrA n=1 Tax=Thermogemmatispora sp. TaxID=1968838 RepID=UPI002636980D|nr:acyl-CoA synthetase FdrA [Thermogemmatispora sp.]MBX5457901.1 acyl-CoA synthetase FdrA [Thermogemmatispora sp.]
MVIQAQVRRRTYVDSITLMQIATALKGLPGVENAAAVMATEANLQLLAEAGLHPSGVTAGADDLLLVVKATIPEAAEQALRAAEELLTARQPKKTPLPDGEFSLAASTEPPHSLEEALRRQPEARLAMISVPGPYAALEAELALRAGLHVFLFSDNVPLQEEIALKQLAQQRGLLLMGPDCGTALLHGVGLGFVNVVPRGPIGIVGASGTGIQQVMSLIAQQGSGISQIIGSGGRDLSREVGAITTLAGIRLLLEDEETRVIVLVSKPPAPEVAARVIEEAASGSKAVVTCFLGADHEALEQRYGSRVVVARTLTDAATLAVQLAATPASYHAATTPASAIAARLERLRQISAVSSASGHLVGLFAGGTLCDEAMQLWSALLGPIYSNIPLEPAWRLHESSLTALPGHCAIDFGADEYTRGRPHPMIDPSLRLQALETVADHPRVAVVLLDLVLGYCAHPDPAAIYAPVIAKLRRRGPRPAIVVSLCGTEGDPQRLSAQAARLQEAGATVLMSNAEAALHCVQLLYEQEESGSVA